MFVYVIIINSKEAVNLKQSKELYSEGLGVRKRKGEAV